MFTLSESFDDEREVEEAEEEDVEFLEAREDSSEALESSEEALYLVALLIEPGRIPMDRCDWILAGLLGSFPG